MRFLSAGQGQASHFGRCWNFSFSFLTPPFLANQALDLFVPTGPSGRGRPCLRAGELTAVLPSPPGEEMDLDSELPGTRVGLSAAGLACLSPCPPDGPSVLVFIPPREAP